MTQKILTITGPTCSGKSTLEQRLLATGRFTDVVGATTRPNRPGERDGIDYVFVDKPTMHSMIQLGQMIEHNEFGGHVYGTMKLAVVDALASGKIPVIILEPNGVRHMREYCNAKGIVHVPIWLDVDVKTRVLRFLARGADLTRLADMIEHEPHWFRKMPEDTIAMIGALFNEELPAVELIESIVNDR